MHGRERLMYAITPRFAPALQKRNWPQQTVGPGVSAGPDPESRRENVAEIAGPELFPEARSYLDIYDRFGLVRETLDLCALHSFRPHGSGAHGSIRRRSGVCPSSNLYLERLFDIAATDAAGMRFSIATDVGAGRASACCARSACLQGVAIIRSNIWRRCGHFIWPLGAQAGIGSGGSDRQLRARLRS